MDTGQIGMLKDLYWYLKGCIESKGNIESITEKHIHMLSESIKILSEKRSNKYESK